MPGKRKWDSHHELFLLAEKQGSGTASSVGTHLAVGVPVRTLGVAAGVALCVCVCTAAL